ncbi:hypothetical protein LTR53_006136 [Teratosphaeriaceae sp. CCFEE 6253]|nr:hypothetical protein LTR53_006136 [Teratosphaeriaceae sp. CCFEE 6253]
MPLSENKQTNETAATLVQTLKGAFGTPPGYRVAHARGTLVTGTFTPTAVAASLSTAPHFHPHTTTPLLVRFSNSTGIPQIPDTDANSNPRGMATRFLLDDTGHRHTDIICHSTPHFPTRTGEGFLAMLRAIGAGKIEEFLAETPSAAAFVQAPKPFPGAPLTLPGFTSYGLNAFKLIAQDGTGTFVRYIVEPSSGHHVLSDEEVQGRSASYLYDELADHLSKTPIAFKYLAQIAEPGDPTDDVTKHWPADRQRVELGTIKLEKLVPEPGNGKDQRKYIFDPIPRVRGIEASEDPLLDMRATVYVIGGKERRAAPEHGGEGAKAAGGDGGALGAA